MPWASRFSGVRGLGCLSLWFVGKNTGRNPAGKWLESGLPFWPAAAVSKRSETCSLLLKQALLGTEIPIAC